MSQSTPSPAIPKSGGFQQEANIFSSINDLFRFFAPLTLKVSRHSPPLASDLKEMQITFDKTALRLYLQVDGVARYVQLT